LSTVIKVENLSKMYHLGTIGYGTLRDDFAAWWAKVRGKEDPNAPVGEKSRIGARGEFWALRDIDFEIKQGDRVGIIGRNGAGKSTLLKILSRITAPTTGRIGIKGRIASLLEVGTGFHHELTGRENVFLNGAILGMKRREIQRKFDEIVDFAGVGDFIDTPVKRYSSGMYVRLAFAVAAHLDAEILVVDEVLAVGDVEFQKKAVGRMEEVSTGQGKTVLFVSHNDSLINQLCFKGILLENGKKLLDGDVVNVLGYYRLNKSYSQIKNDKIELKEININGKTGVVRVNREDEEINLNIKFVCSEKILGKSLRFGFACHDYFGRPLFDLRNDWEGITIKAAQSVEIAIKIEKIDYLSINQYFFWVYVEASNEQILCEPNVISIELFSKKNERANSYPLDVKSKWLINVQ